MQNLLGFSLLRVRMRKKNEKIMCSRKREWRFPFQSAPTTFTTFYLLSFFLCRMQIVVLFWVLFSSCHCCWTCVFVTCFVTYRDLYAYACEYYTNCFPFVKKGGKRKKKPTKDHRHYHYGACSLLRKFQHSSFLFFVYACFFSADKNECILYKLTHSLVITHNQRC